MTARRSHLSSSFLVYFMTTASQFQEVWYEWECSRGDCSSIVATPADSKLMSRTLRLSGLKPDTEYSFNIFAKNSVGVVNAPEERHLTIGIVMSKMTDLQVSKFTDAPAYRVVDLRTSPLTRYVVSGLRVESEQKDGITLAWLSPAVSKRVKYEVSEEGVYLSEWSHINGNFNFKSMEKEELAKRMSPGVPNSFRLRSKWSRRLASL